MARVRFLIGFCLICASFSLGTARADATFTFSGTVQPTFIDTDNVYGFGAGANLSGDSVTDVYTIDLSTLTFSTVHYHVALAASTTSTLARLQAPTPPLRLLMAIPLLLVRLTGTISPLMYRRYTLEIRTTRPFSNSRALVMKPLVQKLGPNFSFETRL